MKRDTLSLWVCRMEATYKAAARVLVGLFVLQGVLVTTHLGDFRPMERRHELGEFWPFSIYPMFSRGAHPWVRSLVREVPDAADPDLWQPYSINDLPGEPYALKRVGILQNDISNFISKSRTWDERRINGLRKVFGDELTSKHLLIMRADGSITGDSVSVVFTPFLLLAPDSTYLNPHLVYATH